MEKAQTAELKEQLELRRDELFSKIVKLIEGDGYGEQSEQVALDKIYNYRMRTDKGQIPAGELEGFIDAHVKICMLIETL